MAQLHLINKAPEHPRFALALKAAAPGDPVVLLAAAEMALARQDSLPADLYVLKPDALARGLSPQLTARAREIGYPELVTLTEATSRIISW